MSWSCILATLNYRMVRIGLRMWDGLKVWDRTDCSMDSIGRLSHMILAVPIGDE